MSAEQRDDDQSQVRLMVHPEPTAEELAAIVGAVTVLRARTGAGEPVADTGPKRSRWASAGRREAMRGIDREDSHADLA